MIGNTDLDLLTVSEAAQILKISTVTLHRWIKQRRLPAYHVGPRKVRIRRSDLAQALAPVYREGEERGKETTHLEATPEFRHLTDREVRDALEALREADELIEAMRAHRKGRALSPSWPLIRKGRDERSKQLL